MDSHDVENWIYRAEGNLHIIVANRRTMQVLRLTKCSKEKVMFAGTPAEATDNEISYIHCVAHPLLKHCKACFPIQRVSVSREFLDLLSKKIELDRPKCRLEKVIDITHGYGILMPDFCQVLPTPPSSSVHGISVEIKPKQGFILPGNDRCKFSQFQQLKVENKAYDRVSAYCPVDLFSGSKKRMKKAINGLIADPQNNFRVFRDGNIIYSQEILKHTKGNAKDMFTYNVLPLLSSTFQSDIWTMPTSKELSQIFQDLLYGILLYPVSDSVGIPHSPQYCVKQSRPDHSKNDHESVLSGNCTLGLLLSLQKLETHSIGDYYKMYMLVQKHLDIFPEDSDALSLSSPYDSRGWQETVENICKCSTSENDETSWKVDVLKAASLLRKFLIATSFKDCSIIMTFQPKLSSEIVHNENKLPIIIKTRHEKEFWASIALVDSDPKPANRIPDYYHNAHMNASL